MYVKLIYTLTDALYGDFFARDRYQRQVQVITTHRYGVIT